jgi:PAS domain S-box-containing protein
MRTFRLRTLLAGALVAAAGLALIAYDLSRAYERDIREAERATRNLTIALEAHTRRSVQAVDLALAALAARPEALAVLRGRDARTLDALLQAQLASLPQATWVTLFDRSGRPVATTDSASTRSLTSVADREYFRALQSPDQKTGAFISAPFFGRTSGRWSIVMSHRLTGADGSFAGVMAAAVEPRFFPALYRNIDIGAHGNVTLFHQNGTIVARSPDHEEFAGRSAASGALFREHLPRADSGTERLKTVLQGREILYSYSRVTDTPLVINVAFDMDDVTARWWQSLTVYAVVALGMVLLVACVVVLVLRNRRRTEAAREQSQATLRTLFDNASEGMLLADARTGRFHSSNPAIRRMLGYSESELARLRPTDIHPPEQRAFVEDSFAAMARGELDAISAIPTLSKDGRVFYTDISALQIEFGGRQYIAGLFRDVTAVHEAHQSLRESQRRLKEAQRIAQIGNWDLDLVGGTLTWSDEIFRLFEIDKTKFGATYEAFLNAIHPEDREAVNAAYTASLSTREPYAITHRLLMADGRIKYVHERCESTFDAQDKPVRSVGTVQDVTERVHAEQLIHTLNAELEQRVAERTAELKVANKELETFTYSVSHDLKGPLRGIDGYSRLLLDGYADRLDDEGRQFLHNVRRAAQQMDQLTNDLLAYSRLERQDVRLGQVEPKPLVEALLAERAADIQARGVAVSVAVSCSPVRVDRDGLAMALRNLVENALKFTRDTPHPAIEVGARDEGDKCVLWVRDNGVGFDMQYHDKIFAIFQRLHRAEDYPGTGVGLAIVRKAMERMGGRAWAQSEPGRGATFYLEIPR